MNRFWQNIKDSTKGMSMRQKAEYVLTYYWYHILGVCAALGLVIFLIVHFAFPAKQPLFSCALVNQQIDYDRDEKLGDMFAESAGISGEQVVIDSDYNISYPGHELKDSNDSSFDKFFIKWSNEGFDAIVMTEDFLSYCVSVGAEFYPVDSFETDGLSLYHNGDASGIEITETVLSGYLNMPEDGSLLLVFPVEGKNREVCQEFIDFIKEQ